jgi:hypothetical protein
MMQQPRVETVEEFKLRIAAIIRAKPEQIFFRGVLPIGEPSAGLIQLLSRRQDRPRIVSDCRAANDAE